jgi:hypothetical protein
MLAPEHRGAILLFLLIIAMTITCVVWDGSHAMPKRSGRLWPGLLFIAVLLGQAIGIVYFVYWAFGDPVVTMSP